MNTFKKYLDMARGCANTVIERVQKESGNVYRWLLPDVSHNQYRDHVWVAKTLHKNGRVFLVDAFGGNTSLADSVNHLLVTSFYLINMGWITLTLRTGADIVDFRQLLELLSDKIGAVLLVLGIFHFANVYVFSRMRKRARPVETQPARTKGGPSHDAGAWRLAD